jgi:hypothetical protein
MRNIGDFSRLKGSHVTYDLKVESRSSLTAVETVKELDLNIVWTSSERKKSDNVMDVCWREHLACGNCNSDSTKLK